MYCEIGVVAKKNIFYGQADFKGGGVVQSAPAALTVSKCENFEPL